MVLSLVKDVVTYIFYVLRLPHAPFPDVVIWDDIRGLRVSYGVSPREFVLETTSERWRLWSELFYWRCTLRSVFMFVAHRYFPRLSKSPSWSGEFPFDLGGMKSRVGDNGTPRKPHSF